MEPKTLMHLFYHCPHSIIFWMELEQYTVCKIKVNMLIDCKSVIKYFVHEKNSITFMKNVFILYGKFHMLKWRFSKTPPNFRSFLYEFKEYTKSLTLIDTKQSTTSTDEFFWWKRFFIFAWFFACFSPPLFIFLVCGYLFTWLTIPLVSRDSFIIYLFQMLYSLFEHLSVVLSQLLINSVIIYSWIKLLSASWLTCGLFSVAPLSKKKKSSPSSCTKTILPGKKTQVVKNKGNQFGWCCLFDGEFHVHFMGKWRQVKALLAHVLASALI